MKKFLKKIVVRVLIFEARRVLKKYQPKIVAITGSVGKTSTKDAVYHALSGDLSVQKSEKSFNSEIGVPLTILGLPNAWNSLFGWTVNILKGFWLFLMPHKYPKVLVLEAGVSAPGDMDVILKIIGAPDIAVVTALPKVPVHVASFKGPEQVYEEKSKLVSALKKDGIFIACGDDKQVLSMKKLTDAEMLTFGFSASRNTMSGSALEVLYEKRLGGERVPGGIVFRVDYHGTSFPVRLHGTLGKQPTYSILAALLVAVCLDQNIVEVTKRFSTYKTPLGRMHLIEGIKDSTIIDDSYNSSPMALRALLETVESLEISGRKIGVLGDMLELGKYSDDAHKKAGEQAAGVFDLLVTVGGRAQEMAEGALAAGMSEKNIMQFEDSHKAGLYLQNEIGSGDVIAVKGSQGAGKDAIRMENAVLEIMAHPENRKEELIRQNEEWKHR